MNSERASRLQTQLLASAEPRVLQRAVVVEGARTPFVKSFGKLIDQDAIDLGAAAVRGLLEKTKLDPNHIDEIIWGNVVLQSSAPNIAREIVIDLKLPTKIPGVTCSRACLSGLQAIEQGIALIETGRADCVIAGGSDSLSNGELAMPRKFTRAMGKYALGGGRKKGYTGLFEAIGESGWPWEWIPKQNEIAERSTGKTMGFHADLMADLNSISRKDQDSFSIDSHRKAYEAQQRGEFQKEIVPIKSFTEDDLIRKSMDPAKVSKLSPAFRTAAENGTVTAASSSALTDGGSCVLLMSERKARELGYPTDISFKSFVNVAIDPFPQLLLAPALAIPKALEIAGLSLDEIDFVEMHEAFAAQVLSTLKCLESPAFSQSFLNSSHPVGTVEPSKLNVNGGSIALGHPFAATGGRIVTNSMRLLRERSKKYCLISICAAGGLGGVAILENSGV